MIGEEARKLKPEEVGSELTRLRAKLFELRGQMHTEKVEDTSQLKKLRKDIARLMTEQSARFHARDERHHADAASGAKPKPKHRHEPRLKRPHPEAKKEMKRTAAKTRTKAKKHAVHTKKAATKKKVVKKVSKAPAKPRPADSARKTKVAAKPGGTRKAAVKPKAKAKVGK
ncbi:hypothetical protein BH11PLA1_BH11PLA1_22750 [soil metagenome]